MLKGKKKCGDFSPHFGEQGNKKSPPFLLGQRFFIRQIYNAISSMDLPKLGTNTCKK